jgi:hypothetical protein
MSMATCLLLCEPRPERDTAFLPTDLIGEDAIVAAPPVRDKLDRMENDISALKSRMQRAEQSSILRWATVNWIPVASLLITMFGAVAGGTAWVLTHVVDDRIDAKLKDHHFDQMAPDVNQMKGQLGEISGFLKALTTSELHRQASLPKERFEEQIPAVAETVTTARVVHAAAPADVVSAIHERLADTPSSTPGYWKAAAQFINYRSDLRADFRERPLPDCFARPNPSSNTIDNSKGYWEVTVWLKDCQVNIDADNLPAFRQAVSRLVAGIPFEQIHYTLELTNARIVYRGGYMIPIDGLTLHNCRFQIETEETAPAPAKILTRELLLASDESSVRVNLS